VANRSTRKMIQVDTVKCDGCGVCIPACPEGALQIIDGKARLVRQSYCDGLGACLGDCPQGALAVVEVEADVYDEAAVIAHLQQTGPELVTRHIAHLQAHAGELRPPLGQVAPVSPCLPVPVDLRDAAQSAAPAPSVPSELRQWPVQLRLLPVRAPFFDEVCLTLIADCVPFAYPNMHADFMRGDTIAVGCPKLDDAAAYVEKLTLMLQENDIRALKVVYMEVPCCRGLVRIAQQALERSGRDIPFDSVMVAIRG
jgi:NAD-dependent dihydropyrimidine dehydrogenase PreA subunit